jgi:hypothetical protein
LKVIAGNGNTKNWPIYKSDHPTYFTNFSHMDPPHQPVVHQLMGKVGMICQTLLGISMTLFCGSILGPQMALTVHGYGIADNIFNFSCTGVPGMGWFDVF